MTQTSALPSTLELTFTAVGEEVLMLKALRDCYERVSQEVVQEELPRVAQYVADQVEKFDRMWRDASFRMRMEEAADEGRLAFEQYV